MPNIRSGKCRHGSIGRSGSGRAGRTAQPLKDVVLEALERGLGLTGKPVRYHDLDDLAGTWVHDPEFDRAVEKMDQIDPELWK